MSALVRLEDFGSGLNLASGPLDPSYAIDALDVTYGRAIRTRPGFTPLVKNKTGVGNLHSFNALDGTARLLGTWGGVTYVILPDGSTPANTSKAFTGAASFASPGSQAAYLADGTNTAFKYTTGGFTSPANMPKARYLAVQTPDNRLVATGFTTGANGPSGATVSESTVYFSNEGAPEVWTANNYVHLTPGDGEKIQGVVAWRNQVFVFKETKFFVFTGNSEDVDGNPMFNYRQLDGAGLVAPRAIATGPQGVYFLADDGIYVTNGGNPEQLLEQEMGPIFDEEIPDSFTPGLANRPYLTGATAEFFDGRLYVSIPMGTSTTNNRTIVMDTKFGWWSIFSFAARDFAVWESSGRPKLAFSSAGDFVGQYPNGTTDYTPAGDTQTAIEAFSRTAWLDAQTECSLRQIKLWGDGRITTSIATNFDSTSGAAVTVTLDANSTTWGGGTWGDGLWGPVDKAYSPANLRGFGARGTFFSITFSGGGTNPLKIEQASCTFLGGRNKE